MFNRSRALISASITAALSFGSALIHSINPFSSAALASSGAGLTGARAKRGTVAQAKRAAQKRRNQLRYKRSLRG